MNTTKKKKRYERAVIQEVKMERGFGAACKTTEPTGGVHPGGDCDGLIGSPPPGFPCSGLGS